MAAPLQPGAGRHVRVLHLFAYFRPDFTGEGIYVERLQPKLRALGVGGDVLAVATLPPGGPVEDVLDPGPFGRIVRLGSRRRHQLTGLFPLWRWLSANLDGYDVVHFHSIVDRTFVAQLMCRLRGLPVVMSCTLDDSAGEHVATYRALYRPLARRLLGLIDCFLAISPRLYDDCLAVVPPERVVLLPQAATPAAPSRSAPAVARTEGEFGMLYMGGICARKGIDSLVEALPALRRAVPGACLHVVGPELEPGLADALRRRAEALGVGDAFRCHGPTEDPESWYRAADILLFGSHREGFGNVLLEAMAAGLPVVARRLPGVNDYFIEDGVSGFLWDDAAAMAAQVARLAADPELRRRVGQAAARRVVQDFGIDAIACRYAVVYAGLLRERSERAAPLAAAWRD